MSQERNILISEKGIYNLKSTSLKRKIEIKFILGITISSTTDEFVIHGSDCEYDYDYVSSRRKKIIEYIAQSYKEINGRELILCEIDQNNIKSVVTQKKEKSKNPSFTRMDEKFRMQLNNYLFVNSASDNKNKDTPKPTQNNTTTTTSPPPVIYTDPKKTADKNVTVTDFNILKVIGRGSFGKVCLVEHKKSKELYAMKSLKKDVLLTQEQIENTLQEKKILTNIHHPFLVSLVFCFQTVDRIYFVMNFLRGGELFQCLKKFRVFDEEK